MELCIFQTYSKLKKTKSKVNALIKMWVSQKLCQTTNVSASPIIANSIFSDLIGVHICTYNLAHGFWSLSKSNNEGNWQWGVTQSCILWGQEFGILSIKVGLTMNRGEWALMFQFDFATLTRTVCIRGFAHMWSHAVPVSAGMHL